MNGLYGDVFSIISLTLFLVSGVVNPFSMTSSGGLGSSATSSSVL